MTSTNRAQNELFFSSRMAMTAMGDALNDSYTHQTWTGLAIAVVAAKSGMWRYPVDW